MDNATFDRLARLLGSGASRRHTLRAVLAAALTGGTAAELLAADKKKNGKDNDKDKNKDKDTRSGKNDGRTRDDNDNDGKDKDKDKEKDNGDDDRVAAQGKNNKNKNKNRNKRKRKKKDKGSNNTGGNSCAGTPLQPGQMFLGCDFSGDNLRGENLESSSFKDVDLTDADLCGANLESTSFTDSKADDANFTDVNFDSSSHDNTSYAGANFTNATFRVSTFNEVDFTGADFTGANLTGATFNDTDFSGAIFCRTVTPDGDIDNSDCDTCENRCGLCTDCDDEDCAPPDCCSDPEGPGGICVDTDTDPLNCGSCNAACFTNLSDACVDGECVCGDEPECSGGDTCCPGREDDEASCVDLDTDTDNCGQCGRLCLSSTNPCITVECIEGVCTDVPADDGTACRQGGQDGVCCAAGSTVTCVVGTVCCSAAQCGAGEACCEGQCIDVQDDAENCGACDVTCVIPINPCRFAVCVDGVCGGSSLPNGTVCEFGEASGVCCGGSCAFGFDCCTDAQCGTGQSCCGGLCLNTSDNFQLCGSCDNACVDDRATACVDGECVCGSEPQCSASETCCPGEGGDPAACFNLQEDVLHCGDCDVACEIPLNPCLSVACQDGQCVEITNPNGSACVVNEQSGICCTAGDASTCIPGDLGEACCTDSQCTATEACCENQCIDVQDNFNNCGACDVSCADSVDQCFNRQCIQGGCATVPDEDGEPCFAGEEGICCASSPTTSICIGGAFCCTDAECLEPGDGCCGNQCIDTQSDRENCGGCGNECDTDRTCIAGMCDLCEGLVCGNTCVPAGPNICCTIDDCSTSTCRPRTGCTDNVCVFGVAPDGTPCGFEGDECVAGECVLGGGGV